MKEAGAQPFETMTPAELKVADVAVTFRLYEGMIHGFL